MATKYAPYYRQGLLCFPDKTLNLLVESGLDAELAKLAHHGLHLDVDHDFIIAINHHMATVLPSLDREIQAELASHDVEFMMSVNIEDEEFVSA